MVHPTPLSTKEETKPRLLLENPFESIVYTGAWGEVGLIRETSCVAGHPWNVNSR